MMGGRKRGRLAWVVLLFLLLERGSEGSLFGPKKEEHTINGPIKTIVILLMENRSFDHMLGWLKRMNPDIDGVTGAEFNHLSAADPSSPKVFFSDSAEFVDPDPGHSFQAIREQIFGSVDTSAEPPPMNGFAQQAESMTPGFSKTVMNGFRPEVVPVYTALAMEFAVCDRWFASVPTSTQPNRLYVHSATSHGATSNLPKDLTAGFPQRTMFDNIHDAGLSFGVYYQNLPSVLFYRNLRQIKYSTKFYPYGLFFKQHAKAGTLPNYVVLEPRYFDLKTAPANDDHPSHDITEGQKLVKEVYETLRASPQWNEMLFLVTYDEHGGFFDHVPTPANGVPSPDGIIGYPPYNFTFNRLGVRVPTLLISPWINKGIVLHNPSGPTPTSHFEHSSISATVKKLFNLNSNFLTQRDAWAGTFESLVYARTSPRTDCPEQLPSSPWSLRHSPPNENRTLTEFQEELVQLAAQLVGDHTLDNYQSMVKQMNIKEANHYVESSVARFIEASLLALEHGMEEAHIVNLKPNDRKT